MSIMNIDRVAGRSILMNSSEFTFTSDLAEEILSQIVPPFDTQTKIKNSYLGKTLNFPTVP